MDALSEIWIHHFFLVIRFALAGIALCCVAAIFVFVRERSQKKEAEMENKRVVQVKALSPPPPSYEVRMGVQYGPHRTPQSSEEQREELR